MDARVAQARKIPVGRFTWDDNDNRILRANLGQDEAELPPGAGDRSHQESRCPTRVKESASLYEATGSVFHCISASLWAFAPFSLLTGFCCLVALVFCFVKLLWLWLAMALAGSHATFSTSGQSRGIP